MRLDLSEAFTTEVREPRWIVKDNIPASTIVMVAGDAGVGKSVMNLCEALHIALGRPFLGQKTTQTKVLYFDEENSRPDILAYLQMLWIGMGQPDQATLMESFRLEHFSLGNVRWPEMSQRIATEWQPGMVYIDTATSALNIDDENDNSEAQEACHHLRHLIRDTETHPAIKLLKHAKYNAGGGHKGKVRRTIRGAKAWKSAVDQTQFHIRQQGAPTREGLHTTVLVPEKRRAFGLRVNLRIVPSLTATEPKGLILNGESFDSRIDLMMVGEEE